MRTLATRLRRPPAHQWLIIVSIASALFMRIIIGAISRTYVSKWERSDDPDTDGPGRFVRDTSGEDW